MVPITNPLLRAPGRTLAQPKALLLEAEEAGGEMDVDRDIHTPMSRDVGGEAARRDPIACPAAPAPAAAAVAEPPEAQPGSGCTSDCDNDCSSDCDSDCSDDCGSDGVDPYEDLQPLEPCPGTIMVVTPGSEQRGALYLEKRFIHEEFYPALGLRPDRDPPPLLEVEACERDRDDLIVVSKRAVPLKPISRLSVSGASFAVSRLERKVPVARRGDLVALTYLGTRARCPDDPEGVGPIHRLKVVLPPAPPPAQKKKKKERIEFGEEADDWEAVGVEEGAAPAAAAAAAGGEAAAAAEGGEGDGALRQGHRGSVLRYPITSDPRRDLPLTEDFLRRQLLPAMGLAAPEGGAALPHPVRMRLQAGGHPAAQAALCTIQRGGAQAGASATMLLPPQILMALRLSCGDTLELRYDDFVPTRGAASEWDNIYAFNVDRVPYRAGEAPPAPIPAAPAAAPAAPAVDLEDRPGAVMHYQVTSKPGHAYLRADFLRDEFLPALGVAALEGRAVLGASLRISLACKAHPTSPPFDCSLQRGGHPCGAAGKLCLPWELLEMLSFQRNDALVLEYRGRSRMPTKSGWCYVYSFLVDREPGPGASAAAAAAPAARAAALAATAAAAPAARAAAAAVPTPWPAAAAAAAAAVPAAAKSPASKELQKKIQKMVRGLRKASESGRTGAKRPAAPAAPPAPAAAKRPAAPAGPPAPAAAKRAKVSGPGPQESLEAAVRASVEEAVLIAVGLPGAGAGAAPAAAAAAEAAPAGMFVARRQTLAPRDPRNQPMTPRSQLAATNPSPSQQRQQPQPPAPSKAPQQQQAPQSGGARGTGPQKPTLATPASKTAAPRRPDASPASGAAGGAGQRAGGGSSGAGGSTHGVSCLACVKQEPGVPGGGVSNRAWNRAAIGCSRSLDAARAHVRSFLGADDDASDEEEEDRERAERAQVRYSLIVQALPPSSEGLDVVADSGAAPPRRSLWGGAEVPWLGDDHFTRLCMFGTEPDDTMAALLRGRAPFRLWVGPVEPTDPSVLGVVALEDIPAGSWVLSAVGEYIFAPTEPSPLVLCIRRGGEGGAEGCVVPRAAVASEEQAAMWEAGQASQRAGWRRLPAGAALDCRRHGGAAAALRRSADPNLGKATVDLMTGPSTIFYFATRIIARGEELLRF